MLPKSHGLTQSLTESPNLAQNGPTYHRRTQLLTDSPNLAQTPPTSQSISQLLTNSPNLSQTHTTSSQVEKPKYGDERTDERTNIVSFEPLELLSQLKRRGPLCFTPFQSSLPSGHWSQLNGPPVTDCSGMPRHHKRLTKTYFITWQLHNSVILRGVLSSELIWVPKKGWKWIKSQWCWVSESSISFLPASNMWMKWNAVYMPQGL
jgi:hypothetical protein